MRFRAPIAPPQEFIRGFQEPDLFGDSHGDELIQRDAIGLGQPRAAVLTEVGSFNGYVLRLIVSTP